MNFSTKNVTVQKKKTSPIMSFGIQEAMIVGLGVQVASTGSKRVLFELEGPAVEEEGFTPMREGSKGQVCTVRTIYMNDEKVENEFIPRVATLAEVLGVRDQVDAIEAASLEEYLEKLLPIVRNKMARFVITTEQFIKQNGKTGNNLGFARFNWVESVSVPMSETKLTFDPTKAYHFKPATTPDMEEQIENVEETDDLPI